jgi:hypothetical protein
MNYPDIFRRYWNVERLFAIKCPDRISDVSIRAAETHYENYPHGTLFHVEQCASIPGN